MAVDKVVSHSGVKHSTVSFRIAGWSVKYSRDSLLAYLARLGTLIRFTHYPQLHSTHVVIRLRRRNVHCLKLIEKDFPKVKVDIEQDFGAHDAEKVLENTEVTAFISSLAYFDEKDIFSKLNPFGPIRAMTFTFSYKLQKWYCKASFYERYSLEQLMSSTANHPGILCHGAVLKIDHFKGEDKTPRARPVPRLEPRHRPSNFQNTEHSLLKLSKCRKSTGISQGLRPSAQQATVYHRRSKSTTKTPELVLPSSKIFSDYRAYLENVLSIASSKKSESDNRRDVSAVRSSSLSSRQRNDTRVVLSLDLKRSKQSKEKSKKDLALKLNELFFLRIGAGNSSKVGFSNKETSNQENANRPGRDSFLSVDDLSDGFTAVEDYYRREPVPKFFRTNLSSQNSGKESSLVIMTEYSSDAGLTLPLRHYNTHSQEFSYIDNLFDSNSVEVKVYPVCQPKDQDHCPNNEVQIAFFTFPCN
jgi:hypothetical protein